jgi:hypothetical protein
VLFDLALAVQQWADWAIEVVQAWPDDPSQAPTDWAAFEIVAQHLPTGRDWTDGGLRASETGYCWSRLGVNEVGYAVH